MLPVILYSFNVQELICNVFEINVIYTFSIPIPKISLQFSQKSDWKWIFGVSFSCNYWKSTSFHNLNRKWKNYDIKIDIEKYLYVFSNYIAECNSIYIWYLKPNFKNNKKMHNYNFNGKFGTYDTYILEIYCYFINKSNFPSSTLCKNINRFLLEFTADLIFNWLIKLRKP